MARKYWKDLIQIETNKPLAISKSSGSLRLKGRCIRDEAGEMRWVQSQTGRWCGVGRRAMTLLRRWGQSVFLQCFLWLGAIPALFTSRGQDHHQHAGVAPPPNHATLQAPWKQGKDHLEIFVLPQ